MKDPLGKAISLGNLLRFTIPTIVMMVFMSLYTIVDGIFVSRLIDTDALSAVNIVYPLLSVVIAIGTMFGTGTSAIVAKKLGEGRGREAKGDFTFIVLVATGLTVLLSLVSLWLLEPILYALGANAAVYAYCWEYAFPLVFFLPASVLQLIFQYLFVTDGHPHLGLAVTIAGGVANMVLDYVFIAWCGWGIAGAAIATGIGYTIPAVFGLVYFTVHRRGSLCFTRPRADRRVLLRSMTNGSSEMVSNLSLSVTTYLFNRIMMHYLGQDGVAAVTIVLYMDFLLIAVSLGYAMGVAPLISYNYGSGDTEKLQRIYRLSRRFILAFSVVTAALTMLGAPLLVSAFAREGTAVYAFAVAGLRLYAVSYLFKGFNIFASSLFTAFSDGKVSAILSFSRTLGFLVLCVLGLTALLGVNGVWIGTPVAEALALGLSLYYIRTRRGVYQYSR